MASDDFNIKYVADLARINLSEEEQQRLGSQLGGILGYVEKLKELNVDGIEPIAHAFPVSNVTRPDEVQPFEDVEALLKNAPSIKNDLFMVPKVVE